MRPRTPLRMLVALVALLGAVAAAEQTLRPWDQQEVAGLARQLARAVSDARDAARRDPSIVGSRDRRVLRYLDAVRRLETATRQLATALEQGQGREETEPIALRVRRFVRDARQHGSGLSQSMQTTAEIAPAAALLEQLAPYYFPASG